MAQNQDPVVNSDINNNIEERNSNVNKALTNTAPTPSSLNKSMKAATTQNGYRTTANNTAGGGTRYQNRDLGGQFNSNSNTVNKRITYQPPHGRGNS